MQSMAIKHKTVNHTIYSINLYKFRLIVFLSVLRFLIGCKLHSQMKLFIVGLLLPKIEYIVQFY